MNTPWEIDDTKNEEENTPWEVDDTQGEEEKTPWDVDDTVIEVPNHEKYGEGNFSNPEIDLSGNNVIKQRDVTLVGEDGVKTSSEGVREGYKPDGTLDPKSNRWKGKGYSANDIIRIKNEEIEAGLVDGYKMREGPSYDQTAQVADVSRDQELVTRQKELENKNPQLSKGEIFEKAKSDQLVDGLSTTAQAALMLTPVGHGIRAGAGLGALAGGASSIVDTGAEAIKGNKEFLSSDTVWDAAKGAALGATVGAGANSIPHLIKFGKGYTKGMGELVKDGEKAKKASDKAKKVSEKQRNKEGDPTENLKELFRHKKVAHSNDEALGAIKEVQELKKHSNFLTRSIDDNPGKVVERITDPVMAEKVLDASPVSSKLAAKADLLGNKGKMDFSVKGATKEFLKEKSKGVEDAKALYNVYDKAKGSLIKGLSDKIGLTRSYNQHSVERATVSKYLSDEGVTEIMKDIPEIKDAVKLLKKGNFTKAADEMDNLILKIDDPKKLNALDEFMNGLEETVDLTSKKRSVGEFFYDNSLQIAGALAEPVTLAAKPVTRTYVGARNKQFLGNAEKALKGDAKFSEDFKKVMSGKTGTASKSTNKVLRTEENRDEVKSGISRFGEELFEKGWVHKDKKKYK